MFPSLVLSLILLFAILPPRISAFLNVQPSQRVTVKKWMASTEIAIDGPNIDPVLLEKARSKLIWETLREKESKPLLNLSTMFQEETMSDASSRKEEEAEKDDTPIALWEDGRNWIQTKTYLASIGLTLESSSDPNTDSTPTTILHSAPHLLRLPPSLVEETVEAILETFGSEKGTQLIRTEPRLLTYLKEDVLYGMEFLSVMMGGLPPVLVTRSCRATPALLIAGIDGGLRERSVGRALGEAGSAAYGVNKRIAGDAAGSIKDLKGRRMR